VAAEVEERLRVGEELDRINEVAPALLDVVVELRVALCLGVLHTCRRRRHTHSATQH
jgi:hypothetical protein